MLVVVVFSLLLLYQWYIRGPICSPCFMLFCKNCPIKNTRSQGAAISTCLKSTAGPAFPHTKYGERSAGTWRKWGCIFFALPRVYTPGKILFPTTGNGGLFPAFLHSQWAKVLYQGVGSSWGRPLFQEKWGVRVNNTTGVKLARSSAGGSHPLSNFSSSLLWFSSPQPILGVPSRKAVVSIMVTLFHFLLPLT